MTNKTVICGFQPTGDASQIPKPPKFNTDKLSVEKLQEQLNTAKKALTEIAEFDCSDDCYFTARDALAAIGGDDDSNF